MCGVYRAQSYPCCACESPFRYVTNSCADQPRSPVRVMPPDPSAARFAPRHPSAHHHSSPTAVACVPGICMFQCPVWGEQIGDDDYRFVSEADICLKNCSAQPPPTVLHCDIDPAGRPEPLVRGGLRCAFSVRLNQRNHHYGRHIR